MSHLLWRCFLLYCVKWTDVNKSILSILRIPKSFWLNNLQRIKLDFLFFATLPADDPFYLNHNLFIHGYAIFNIYPSKFSWTLYFLSRCIALLCVRLQTYIEKPLKGENRQPAQGSFCIPSVFQSPIWRKSGEETRPTCYKFSQMTWQVCDLNPRHF